MSDYKKLLRLHDELVCLTSDVSKIVEQNKLAELKLVGKDKEIQHLKSLLSESEKLAAMVQDKDKIISTIQQNQLGMVSITANEYTRLLDEIQRLESLLKERNNAIVVDGLVVGECMVRDYREQLARFKDCVPIKMEMYKNVSRAIFSIPNKMWDESEVDDIKQFLKASEGL